MGKNMNANRKRKIVTAVLAAGVVLALVGAVSGTESPFWLGVTVGLFILAMILQVRFYRCPHCGRYIGKSFYGEANCPRCNRLINPELRTEKSERKKSGGKKKKKK